MSEPEIATTFFFTDDPILVGITSVKALHFTELRTVANLARVSASLSESQWITTAPASSGVVRAQQILEMRAVIDEARRFLGVLPLTYTDPALTVGTKIKAIHLQEIRNGLK